MEAQAPSPQTTMLILLGASEWPQFPEFQSSKAFANAARGVRDYFLDPQRFGIPLENVFDAFDSKSSNDELDAQIGQFLEQRLATMKATGQDARDLLVYFVGHGGFVGRDSDFYLAIRRTRMENPRVSGISMLSLADTLMEKARYLRRIIILDCCFAAAAFSAFQAGPAQVALEKTRDAFEIKQRRGGFPAKGTTLLCSSSQKSPSLLLPDGSSTMFTKSVLDALAEGMISQRNHLSLREVKDLAADLLSVIRNAPKPVVLSPDQSEGDVADIPFFPNPRAEEKRRRQAEEVERARRMEEERARRIEEERSRHAEEERERKAREEQERQVEEERHRQAEKAEQLRKAGEPVRSIEEQVPPTGAPQLQASAPVSFYQRNPLDVATPSSSPSLSPLPTVEPSSTTSTIHGQQSAIARNQTGSFSLFPQVKGNSNFLVITGVLFLVAIVIGGSIFFFAKNNGSPTTTTTTTAPVSGKNCKKVGVLLPDTASSVRWDNNDRPALQADIPQQLPGATVLYNNAQGSADTQQAQAQADLTNGACILVLAPVDSVQAASIVAAAKAKHVPVISYDRLIWSNDTNYYVSFDGVAVGKLQGQYIADHYQTYVTANGTNNTVMISGAQTDNNALLFSKGAHQALDPLFSAGTLKKVYERFTPNWTNATAQIEMQAALTANGNKVAVAYVANDGMANNVIAALKAVNLNGKVLVTGQDATVAGLQNILKGDQAMTVYKAIPKEAMATAQLAAALSKGIDTTSLINGQSVTVPIPGGVAVASILETPVAVDKSNIQSTVIADNFVTVAQLCAGLPAGTGGICP